MSPRFLRSAPRRGPLGPWRVSSCLAPLISVTLGITPHLPRLPWMNRRDRFGASSATGGTLLVSLNLVKPIAGKRPIKTLERVLSKAGLGSRTEARQWIGARRVQVNGKVIGTPDHWVDLERDTVTLDGKPVRASKRIYLLLYKPKGYITTYKDPQGRPTVYDLIRDTGQWVVPVGRLDQDTSGLLLLTNDTRFAEIVTNPEFKIPKTYLVKTSTRLTGEQIEQLGKGVILNDGPTQPATVNRIRDSAKYSF